MFYAIEGDAIGEVIAVCPDLPTAELVARAVGRPDRIVARDEVEAIELLMQAPHAATEWAKRRAPGAQAVLPLRRSP